MTVGPAVRPARSTRADRVGAGHAGCPVLVPAPGATPRAVQLSRDEHLVRRHRSGRISTSTVRAPTS